MSTSWQTYKDGQESRVHVNRMHIYPGNLSPEQLLAESAKQEEYPIETVHSHQLVDGTYWFYVKWLGYPQGPVDDDDAWVAYQDCRFAPAIKNYVKAHHLHPSRRR